MSSIEQKLNDYMPMLKKLAGSPLKEFKDQKPIHLQLSQSEREELFHDFKAYFVELYHTYDSSKGASFHTYVTNYLGWYAHHKGEKIVKERKELTFKEDMDEYAVEMELDEIDFSDEISFEMEGLLNELPNKCGKVIKKHFIEGKDMHLVASEMGIAYKTALKHREIGLKKLRESIKKRPE